MRNYTPVLLLVALSGGTGSHAQESGPTLTRGALSLDASLGVVVGHDDNVLRSAVDERSSWVSRLEPAVALSLSPSTYDLSLAYSGEYSWYAQAESADYLDHALRARAAIPFLRRGELELLVEQLDQHEDVGAGLTEGLPVELLPDGPDRLSGTTYAVRAGYGKADSTLRVGLELGGLRQGYKNNLERTRQFDRDEKYATAEVGVRVSPATALVLDLTTKDVTYDRARQAGGNRNSREYEYRLGVDWEASGSTSGSIHGGYLRKEFADREFSGPVWAIIVNWSPLDRTRFEFGTSRTAEEATSLTASAIDSVSYSFGWHQNWPRGLASRLEISSMERDFIEGTVGQREDLLQLGLGLTYEARSWLIWDLSLHRESESSTVRLSEYERGLVNISATVRF